MGKWTTFILPANFDIVLQRLKTLSSDEINKQWEANNCPTLQQFGLSWYSGISGNGWACIDDSTSTKVFQLFVPRQDYVSSESKCLYWEKLACLLALEMLKEKS
jgi:hypothetical protein